MRVLPLAVLLLGLGAIEPCTAAEVTVGGYSLQLPEGWEVQGQDAKSLAAGEPGGMSLNAFAISTVLSPEENMQKMITDNLEKKPGYKFLEKGSVKNSAGNQGCFVRYQRDATSGRVWVDYYFQVADKQILILVFGYPGANSTSVKGVIETIFNSVKVAAAGNS